MDRFIMMLLLFGLSLTTQALAEPTIITLTQTTCQFIESEVQDYNFHAKTADECISINANTQEQRLHAAKVLQLKPGSYLFRVYNRDVPYVLGFWLRGKGLSRMSHASVSGGDIHMGDFKDYAIDLEAGEYWYSCPLNPTPNYSLVVQ